jgi:hypothetical protein
LSHNFTFTSTYSHYKILLDIQTTSVTGGITMRLRASGTDNSSSNYVFSGRGFQSNGSANDNASAGALTSWEIGSMNTAGIGMFNIDLFNPQATKKTLYNCMYAKQDSATAGVGSPYYGFATVTTSYDSATILSSGNLTGTYTIYGYSK